MCNAAARSSDELEGYLERRGLDRLLVIHLEEQFDQARDAVAQQAIAQRLAAVYGRLVERSVDPETIAAVESRVEMLAAAAGPEAGSELRLALLSARHRGATRTLELHRMRAVSDEDLQSVAAALNRMLVELEELARVLGESTRQLQQRLSRSGGTDAAVLAQSVERAVRLEAQAVFLHAWGLYYSAMLGPDRGAARRAIPLFAAVLDLPPGSFRPEDASRSLLEQESYARAVLGMALATGFDAKSGPALDWLELLEEPHTHPDVLAELPAWRIAMFVDAERGGEFRAAREVMETLLSGDDPVPIAWLRLAAARGLEEASSSQDARALAAMAVGALAARGEVAQVMDLARRFGGSAIGDEGFVQRYVRGVERFEAARLAHGGDEPTADEVIRGLYAEAATALQLALADPDSAAYRDGTVACRALLAWCHYYQGEFRTAADLFRVASEQQRPAEAAEAKWMAIVSLDRLARVQPGDSQLQREIASLIAEFLADHPSSRRAGRLALRQALDAEPSIESLDALRQVPPESDAFVAAQRQIVQVLYRLTRAAEGDERLELSREFLSRLVTILDDDDRRIASGEEALRDGRIVRLRQGIEIALTPGLGRESLVRSLLDRLQADPDASVAHAAEIAFRRVQLAVAEMDLAAAERWAAAVAQEPDGREWRAAVSRSIFRLALTQWRDAGGEDQPGTLAAIDEWGSAALAEALNLPEPEARRRALADPRNLPVLAGTAEAVVRRWRMSREPEQAVRAELLLRALLEIREDDESAVRWLSIVLEETGRLDSALALVRRLVAASQSGTPAWFEARYRQIDLLRRLDPARARAVMEQHRALHPNYGPPPWDERFEALDRRLDEEQPESGGIRS